MKNVHKKRRRQSLIIIPFAGKQGSKSKQRKKKKQGWLPNRMSYLVFFYLFTLLALLSKMKLYFSALVFLCVLQVSFKIYFYIKSFWSDSLISWDIRWINNPNNKKLAISNPIQAIKDNVPYHSSWVSSLRGLNKSDMSLRYARDINDILICIIVFGCKLLSQVCYLFILFTLT